jgi:PTH2 family peptidyl-tRNA hydrolase
MPDFRGQAGGHGRTPVPPWQADQMSDAGTAADGGIKQVIVIRKDLRMRRGKECAQAAHASMAFITRRLSFPAGSAEARAVFSPPEITWLTTRFRKVTLQVDSEEERLAVYDRGADAGLVVHLITDAGLTEFGGEPTRTCLAIGPDYDSRIDAITGDLKLY